MKLQVQKFTILMWLDGTCGQGSGGDRMWDVKLTLFWFIAFKGRGIHIKICTFYFLTCPCPCPCILNKNFLCILIMFIHLRFRVMIIFLFVSFNAPMCNQPCCPCFQNDFVLWQILNMLVFSFLNYHCSN